MFASVGRCTNVSTTQSCCERGGTDISNMRSAAFDFQQTDYTFQTNRTIDTLDRGSFMLVAIFFHMCTFMLSHHSLTLKKRSKVRSDITKRFTGYCFLKEDCTLETSRTNNKRDRGTFMLTHPSLTLKEQSKVKSDTTERFTVYGFLKVNCTL